MTIFGGAALAAAMLAPADYEGWTLQTFAVMLVIYLLWKGERAERNSSKWREDSLATAVETKDAIVELRRSLEQKDRVDSGE